MQKVVNNIIFPDFPAFGEISTYTHQYNIYPSDQIFSPSAKSVYNIPISIYTHQPLYTGFREDELALKVYVQRGCSELM